MATLLSFSSPSKFGGPPRGPYGDASPSDHWLFSAGDQVTFWRRDGTPLEGEPVHIIQRVDEFGILLVGDVTQSVSGCILRLASSLDYSNSPTLAGADCTDRPFVFLADESDRIARPGGAQEDADMYG